MIGLCFVVLTLLAATEAVNIIVPAGSQECFFETAERGDKFVAHYYVFAGGSHDVDVQMTGPDQKNIYSVSRGSGGTFQFVAMQNGRHTVCFSNAMSVTTEKHVSFDVKVGHVLHGAEAANQDDMEKVSKAVGGLNNAVVMVKNKQHYTRLREERCRETAESTNGRVLHYQIFESLILVGLVCAQIFYVRGLFERKKGI